jgi:predicted transcriptional regulator
MDRSNAARNLRRAVENAALPRTPSPRRVDALVSGHLAYGPLFCSTLYDVRSALTIRLDPDLERLLDRLCRQTGRTRSDLVRDALRRQLKLLRFEQLRRQVLPFAEARGYLTDEEIARDVS